MAHENSGVSLASLARLFHLAAIRPDKSRGPANRRGGTIRTPVMAVNPIAVSIAAPVPALPQARPEPDSRRHGRRLPEGRREQSCSGVPTGFSAFAPRHDRFFPRWPAIAQPAQAFADGWLVHRLHGATRPRAPTRTA